MHNQSSKKVLIIGGGIGGLAAAIALRKVGIAATVYESSNALREIGAGLTLWRNAVRAIEKLGLSNELAAIGMPMSEGGVRSWRGDVLSETFVDRHDPSDAQATVVHRAELLAMLSAALIEGVAHLQTKCVGFKQDDAGGWAQFADGSEVFGDALGGGGIRERVDLPLQAVPLRLQQVPDPLRNHPRLPRTRPRNHQQRPRAMRNRAPLRLIHTQQGTSRRRQSHLKKCSHPLHSL